MGNKSRYQHSTGRGEALVPRELVDLLLRAVGAKAPTAANADEARDCARRLQGVQRSAFVSAKRLRENHKWLEKDSYQPWAVLTGAGRVYVVPKDKRRADEATLKNLAISPMLVMAQDKDDRDDASQDWMPLGNSGRGKVIWELPAWVKLSFSPKGAEWLKDGLAAACEKRGEDKRALIDPSPDENVRLAYCFDLCAYWTNPDHKRPVLSGVFDQDGRLAAPKAATETLEETVVADEAGWQEALAVDAEADAAAQSSDGAKASEKAARPAKMGDEA